MEPENEVSEEVVADEVIEDTTDKTEDVTDWKAKYEETQGRLKRAETKLSKFKEPETKTETAPSKPSDLDWGQKAFLLANGIKGSDETGLVKDFMANTGKSLDEVMESKYFQSELKEFRDAKLTENAVPSGSKRTGQTAQSTVEYWLSKGELPPTSEVQLRREVVNARLKAEKSGNVFTTNPVVGKING